MTDRRFRPVAIASSWGDGNTQTPVVRIHAGSPRSGVAVSYDEIPYLIKKLERLHQAHIETETLADQIVTE